MGYKCRVLECYLHVRKEESCHEKDVLILFLLEVPFMQTWTFKFTHVNETLWRIQETPLALLYPWIVLSCIVYLVSYSIQSHCILYLIASNLIVVYCILLDPISLYLEFCCTVYLCILYHMSFITFDVWSNYAGIKAQNVMRVFKHHKVSAARFMFLAFLELGFLTYL